MKRLGLLFSRMAHLEQSLQYGLREKIHCTPVSPAGGHTRERITRTSLLDISRAYSRQQVEGMPKYISAVPFTFDATTTAAARPSARRMHHTSAALLHAGPGGAAGGKCRSLGLGPPTRCRVCFSFFLPGPPRHLSLSLAAVSQKGDEEREKPFAERVASFSFTTLHLRAHCPFSGQRR